VIAFLGVVEVMVGCGWLLEEEEELPCSWMTVEMVDCRIDSSCVWRPAVALIVRLGTAMLLLLVLMVVVEDRSSSLLLLLLGVIHNTEDGRWFVQYWFLAAPKYPLLLMRVLWSA